MQLRRKLYLLLVVVLLLCSIDFTVFAKEVPDLSAEGSIHVTMQYGGSAVSGGSFTLYKAGMVQEDDSNYCFVLTGDFAECGISLEDIDSAERAEELAEYADAYKFVGTEKQVDNGGKVSFTGLEPGLYLLVQHQAASGYQAVTPFLVSVPVMEDGVYVYDVDASPKVELVKVPDTNEPPEPVKPSGPTLPQTGQLNWPIPLLAVMGLALFSIGWLLRFGKEKRQP